MICWDSLKTNMSVLKGLRREVYKKHRDSDPDHIEEIYPLFSVRCAIHQIALTRKVVMFFFNGHWSSIVRLGHLFEVSTFRSQFREATIRVICSHFKYITVAQLPSEAVLWRNERLRGLLSTDPTYSVRRQRLHLELMDLDNGNPSEPVFVHYCTGCCVGNSVAERERYALLKMCRIYSQLFCSGYAVPLTYRWLHAGPAMQYCKDSCLQSLIIFFDNN